MCERPVSILPQPTSWVIVILQKYPVFQFLTNSINHNLSICFNMLIPPCLFFTWNEDWKPEVDFSYQQWHVFCSSTSQSQEEVRCSLSWSRAIRQHDKWSYKTHFTVLCLKCSRASSDRYYKSKEITCQERFLAGKKPGTIKPTIDDIIFDHLFMIQWQYPLHCLSFTACYFKWQHVDNIVLQDSMWDLQPNSWLTGPNKYAII